MALEGAIAALSSGDDSPEQKPSQAGPLSGAIAALSSPVSAAPTLKAVPKPSGPVMTGEDPGPGMAEAALQTVSGIGSSIIGGWRGLATLAGGGSADEAAQAIKEEQDKRTYQPTTESGKRAVTMLASPVNPMNWPALAGQRVGDALAENGQPLLGAAAVTAATAAPLLFLRGGKAITAPKVGNTSMADAFRPAPPEAIPASPAPAVDIPAYMRKGQPVETAPATSPSATPVATPEATPVAGPAPDAPITVPSTGKQVTVTVPKAGPEAQIESAPVPGGLPPGIQEERAAFLQRLGLNQVWKSAVEGDVMSGATNAQLANIDEPAGRAAHAQFEKEYDALTNLASDITAKTGGTDGTSQDAIYARGQRIAAPFDELDKWFKKSTSALYAEADKRTQGAPAVSTEPIESALNDRTLNNSALAQDKMGLINAAKNQLELFKEKNPEGLTVQNAEQYRQWLNENWSNANKQIVGKLKDAVDEAVMQSAGEDLYGLARNMHKLRAEKLDNPKGIARLMDVDPNTPINRTTPIEKIPETIARLPIDQFKNVINTLREMPVELQPQAESALAEIKSHFTSKLAEMGQPDTKVKTPFWNNRKVNNFLDDNNYKIRELFSPEEISSIHDLRRAGNILAVDAKYPGAAAQAANIAKQGLMSRLIKPAATYVGGFLGGAFAAPGAGAVVGDAIGAKAAARAGEAGALRRVGSRMIPLSEVGK